MNDVDPKPVRPDRSHPISVNPDSINLSHTFNTTSTFTSTTSSSSSSTPDWVRHAQAAVKRHRPVGLFFVVERIISRALIFGREIKAFNFGLPVKLSNGIRPRRCLVPQRETLKDSTTKPHSTLDAKSSKEDIPQGHISRVSISHSKNVVSATGEKQEDASITPPSEWGSTISTLEENFKTFNAQRDQTGPSARSGSNHTVASSAVENVEVKKKVHFATENNATSRENTANCLCSSAFVESSCVTSTLIDSTSAPMISSTTYFSQPQMSCTNLDTETAGKVLSHQSAVTSQAIMDPPSSKVSPSDAKLDNSKSEKIERGTSGKAASTSRKKGYDPEFFFKVNGKLYQRLGKIGSGGSSEVHKVISSECKIYALKKIKLKGRDYATAYGFCQEINYLNTLKGKNNIIQLIDYEVTDKTLLQEVTNNSMSNKDYRVKNDEYIYMVLEYGEIDLAHMLSQKWKELDSSKETIDENWLRFYWQQILLAVNTIHEKRIVHSDLKPANFLLVRGSLKLIDFGIAKAIMNDTTNIQRDSQVGTLSYMSPEAFMCNEEDANGNIIKCGRASDIWSLGCILYQMVYGRTPFSDYKTFWAKFKVITDPNHEIVFEPMSNPWLLDLMKKCLAWDRNERWRIPQLLQHPFLVPPVPRQSLHYSLDKSCELFQLIDESSGNDHKALMLCSQLQSMIRDPRSVVRPDSSSISRDQLGKLLGDISTVCFQLQEQLSNLEKDTNV
ncbi:hypothetical protein BUALT_Bualt01G0007500 [Buddleja alternifolia]|uniref:Protein kinase domain-containing protein n=1 Tax=Buddleja alternifolia TaxID=168488 RepID=A0AAV6YEE8_9LAMI|nr:hypothetical protein BUALT_Bualt01G0007500 [Buddleja alternifolia]